MTTTGSVTTVPEFEEAFSLIKYRGPDDTRVQSAGRGIMGFHRLAIMGLTPEGMQPFDKDGCSVICNGELYGFQKTRKELEDKGFTFRSGSDCELYGDRMERKDVGYIRAEWRNGRR